MEEAKIPTLHPVKGKKNSPISAEKYDVAKAAILEILGRSEPTHTELANQLTTDLQGKISGNVGWCVMVVKLDLEARKIIERTRKRPPTYRINPN